jgi:drug/metabolite transporter (DMT)-like permease
MVWNSVFGTAWTTYAMSFAQQEVDASTSAIAYASEPAFAMVISMFVFGKIITPIQWIALFLIFSSNILSSVFSFVNNRGEILESTHLCDIEGGSKQYS